ncbi:MAG: M24 family metallopeptidase, partial [Dehalococcoidia bacterium]|nr:M24 family metallopeptidase [Dehalococcoidia bacterium]
GFKTVGFESDVLSFSSVRSIETGLSQAAPGCRAIPADGLVETLRMVKNDAEIALIQKACVLADGVFSHVCSVIHVGMTERELAWGIEKWLRENGSGAVPFNIIVASGPNSALPHHEPGERTFAMGEPIVMDLGATVGGYCSDMTRTVFLGEIDGKFANVYETVLEAQQRAIAGISAEMAASDADELARSVIRSAGFGDAFGHGLGHGVGLQVHERPTVSFRSADVLTNGMVFTVEPGIYLLGLGGVRIEDTVMLSAGMAKRLTFSNKSGPVMELR